MNKTKQIALALALVAARIDHAHADYNANMTGTVTQVLTYASDDRIYFVLDNQPVSHPSCDRRYFAIDATLPEGRRHQILSRLLTAYASKHPLNIGFDNQGDCAHSKIRVHRVG